jgi:hypothetical protein
MNTLTAITHSIAFPPIIVGAFAVLLYYIRYQRSLAILRQWARLYHVEIVHAEFRWFFHGPYTFLLSRWQTVFRVKVRNHAGFERTGWVRCGGFWSGWLGNSAEVKWDDGKSHI